MSGHVSSLLRRGTSAAAVAAAALAVAGAGPAAPAVQTDVVVPRGEPVRIAFASDLTGFAAPFAPPFERAVRLALEALPTVRGFPVRLEVFDAPCGDAAADAATAAAIASDPRHVGVLGQLCSLGFDAALPVYEAAGLAVVTGSATAAHLPAFAPTVFNRTPVHDDDGFERWYEAVRATPVNVAWRQAYEDRFGEAPSDLADLYYDAALVLVRALQRSSRIDGGSLVVDRTALAREVRATHVNGATCRITLDAATGNRVNDPGALARCADADGAAVQID